MMMTLLVISVITAGLIPVYAATSVTDARQARPLAVSDSPVPYKNLKEAIQVQAADLSTLDESTIDEQISKAREAETVEEDTGSPIWYLNANGYTTITEPVTDAAQTRFRVKLQMIAEKVKVTEFGVLYRVHWGRVTHHGDQYTVDGYALLDGNGVFYLALEGETSFKAVGRINGAWFGVRVSMKGYIVDDGVTYSHMMRGWAIPLTQNLILRLRNHLQK